MASRESSKRTRGCLGRGGCLLAVIALVVLVPAILLLTWSTRASRRAEAELAKIRTAGEPTTPDELATFYPTARAERDTARTWLVAVQPNEAQRELRLPDPELSDRLSVANGTAALVSGDGLTFCGRLGLLGLSQRDQ